ncbi:MAG TPA: iron-sulfur cluster assembly scaffold protein [Acidobacteriota bacterium]|nr:iron-sulfur cluster assembly scaffold protein [Acidobacteriota bacterium]
MYSPKVRRLVGEMPNRGRIDDATHVGQSENPICGDRVVLYLRFGRDRLEKASFQADGCTAALAAAAGLLELIVGRTALECARITTDQLLIHLEGLPRHKTHGAEVAVAALQEALTAATANPQENDPA